MTAVLEPRPTLLAWIRSLQGAGRYTFTDLEAAEALGVSRGAVYQAARRLRRDGRLALLRPGFYTVVPPEFVAQGVTPPSWFVDPLMTHLGQDYYVGLLSAAALHGASHQASMTFQVVTDRATSPVEVGRVRVAFVKSRLVEASPCTRVNTPTGTLRVSTREATALDLVRHRRVSGGLSHVATVLAELAEEMDPDLLLQAVKHHELSVVQRTGYLLELAAGSELVDGLHRWLERRRTFAVALRPDLEDRGAALDARWKVLVNDAVEVDL